MLTELLRRLTRPVRRMAGAPAAENAEALAAYSAARSKASAAEREKRALREVVDQIPAGEIFGGWRKRFGTPAENVDLDAVRAKYAEHGWTVPMKDAAAPLIVEYVGRGEA